MFKKIQTLLFFSSSIVFANAQTIIPKVGLTVSSLHASQFITEMDNTFARKTGFTAGVAYNVPVASFGKGLLSVQPEINYTQQGFKANASGRFFGSENYITLDTKQDYVINYLTIPVLAKYELGSEKIKFSVHAGASVGFALGGKFKNVMTITADEGTSETNTYKGDVVFYNFKPGSDAAHFDNNIDFSLQGGIGVTLLNKIAVEARYGYGLTDITHGEQSKNRVVQFTVGVPIHIK